MTITFKNITTQPTTKNAAMSEIDETTLVETDFERLKGGNVRIATYALSTGAGSDETIVVVRHEYVPVSDQTRVSIRLLTNVEDSTLDPVLVGQYEAGVFWNYPGKHQVDSAQVMSMLECAFGLVAVSYDATTGVPETTIVDALDRGATQQVWG